MDSNERNLFSQFERQPYVDLTEWRQELVEYTEAHIEPTKDELSRYLVRPLSPAAYETLMNTVMSRLVRDRMNRIEPLVRSGDRICVKGNIVYDTYTRSGHSFESGWLDEESELWGKFQTVAVRDYLDEGILDADLGHLTEAFVGAHIRHYGAHLVLMDPVEIMPDGSKHGIPDCESLFIPLMYRRLNLTGYLSWDT